MRKNAIIELSHRMVSGVLPEPLGMNTKVFDVTEALPDVKHRSDIWYILSRIDMSSHAGTHVELPFHHWKAGADAASFPIERLVGPAVVLNFSNKKNGEKITLDEVRIHDKRIKEGDMVFIRTDMDKLFFDKKRWTEQPYLTVEAMDWLVAKKPCVIGTDASGFEVPGTDYQPNHLNMFQNNIAMVESATNLAAIGDERVMCFVLPLPIQGIDSCPVRIIAIRKGDLNYE